MHPTRKVGTWLHNIVWSPCLAQLYIDHCVFRTLDIMFQCFMPHEILAIYNPVSNDSTPVVRQSARLGIRIKQVVLHLETVDASTQEV